MTHEILTALSALRDRVRRSLLENPDFRALVSIEQSISEIGEALNSHSSTLSAQMAAEESALAPPPAANVGRSIFDRTGAQPQQAQQTLQQAQQGLQEHAPVRHAQPFLPTHRVA